MKDADSIKIQKKTLKKKQKAKIHLNDLKTDVKKKKKTPTGNKTKIRIILFFSGKLKL